MPLDEAVAQVAAALAPVRSASVDPLILPVLLSPDHVVRGENVAQRALGWGGGITAPAIKDVPASTLEAILLELIEPGGAEDAFARKGVFGALGTFIVLDLGSPIGINRIRFYPRNTVQNAPQYPFQTDFYPPVRVARPRRPRPRLRRHRTLRAPARRLRDAAEDLGQRRIGSGIGD